MLYKIQHYTQYTYSLPVTLQPHIIRLIPRCDNWQKLHSFQLKVSPTPQGMGENRDLDGNSVMKLWFDKQEKNTVLNITAYSEIETYQSNPFIYLLESWALNLPWDYPKSLLMQLQPYLQPYEGYFAPEIIELAETIYQQTQGNILEFLSTLNQWIYDNCEYINRTVGEPWRPGVTYRNKKGSCRDFAVLFMDVARVMEIPTRFVSGYQEGDIEQQERDLHAWVEVYLPGGGWRGYDPTQGMVVSDRHIPLFASIMPSYTVPVFGSYAPVNITSQLYSKITFL